MASQKRDDTHPVVYLIKMLFCVFGALFLAASDLFTNISSSDVLGSTHESQTAWWLVSVGCVVGMMGLGCMAELMQAGLERTGVYVVALLASIFSGALTVNAMSIDYAVNDQSQKNADTSIGMNKLKLDNLQNELNTLHKKMAECERDNYYKPCLRTEKRISDITSEMNQIIDNSVRSEEKRDIDLTYTVEEKSGLDGQTMERVMIYTRAGFVSIMIFMLSIGCSKYFGLFMNAKKQRAA